MDPENLAVYHKLCSKEEKIKFFDRYLSLVDDETLDIMSNLLKLRETPEKCRKIATKKTIDLNGKPEQSDLVSFVATDVKLRSNPMVYVSSLNDDIMKMAEEDAFKAAEMCDNQDESMYSELLANEDIIMPASNRDEKPSTSSNSFGSDEENDSDTMGVDDAMTLASKVRVVRNKRKNLEESSVSSSSTSTEVDSDDDVKPAKKRTNKKQKVIKSDSESDFNPTNSSESEEVSDIDSLKDSDSDASDSSSKDEIEGRGDRKVRVKKEPGKSDKSRRDRKHHKKSGKGRIKDRHVIELSSDEEDQGKNAKKGQRKMMTDAQLEQATRNANKAEKDRMQRLSEREKFLSDVQEVIYSPKKLSQTPKKVAPGEITDESGDDMEVTEPVKPRVILDADMTTKEPIVEVHQKLAAVLKPHQMDGIKFMFNSTIETAARLEEKDEVGSGCILAHSMGLGKTLQVIAFVHTLLTNKLTKGHIKTALIVVPVNVTKNWQSEFNHWLFEKRLTDFIVWELSSETTKEKEKTLNRWHSKGGVVIIGHNAFSKFVNAIDNKKTHSSTRAIYEKCLVDPGPDLIFVDEGHYIKNPVSQLNRALTGVRTQRRIILTGTPLQNNLEEYYTMVNFVKPSLLGTLKEFKNRFSNPIKHGEAQDSTDNEVKVMKRRAHVLYKRLGGCVQRLDYTVLAPYLQPKYEYVIKVQLTEVQIKLYKHYLDNFAQRMAKGSLLADANVLKLICAHPSILYTFANRQLDRNFVNEKDAEFTDEEDIKDEVTMAVLSDKTWFEQHIPDKDEIDLTIGAKFNLLFEILAECERLGEKLLVFTQSLDTIDLLEQLLKSINQETNRYRLVGKADPNSNGLRNTWEPDRDYFKITGAKSGELRKKYIDEFNKPSNKRARLFILSTRAGSLGINLIGANRSIIFDASWNPSFDVQAIFRTYRFGQKRPVYIYRFVASGCMEERIYERQIVKESLAKRVVDEKQIERHFTKNDIQELYRFHPKKEKEIPPVPKDKLLADMLVNESTKNLIHGYHVHDSLLESKPDEGLDEEERQAAWEEYEAEKNLALQEKLRNEQLRKNQEENQKKWMADHLAAQERMAVIQAAQAQFLSTQTRPTTGLQALDNDVQRIMNTSMSSSVLGNMLQKAGSSTGAQQQALMNAIQQAQQAQQAQQLQQQQNQQISVLMNALPTPDQRTAVYGYLEKNPIVIQDPQQFSSFVTSILGQLKGNSSVALTFPNLNPSPRPSSILRNAPLAHSSQMTTSGQAPPPAHQGRH